MLTTKERTFWVSSSRMTVAVDVLNGLITETPPVVRVFIGQPFTNLVGWMRKQKEFSYCELHNAVS